MDNITKLDEIPKMKPLGWYGAPIKRPTIKFGVQVLIGDYISESFVIRKLKVFRW